MGFPNARQRNVFLFLPGWYRMNIICLSGCRFPYAGRNLTGCTFILQLPALAASARQSASMMFVLLHQAGQTFSLSQAAGNRTDT